MLCLCVQQFSAGLSQYKLKKFGGFKVAKVLRELQRGKRLVSSQCATVKEILCYVAHLRTFFVKEKNN